MDVVRAREPTPPIRRPRTNNIRALDHTANPLFDRQHLRPRWTLRNRHLLLAQRRTRRWNVHHNRHGRSHDNRTPRQDEWTIPGSRISRANRRRNYSRLAILGTMGLPSNRLENLRKFLQTARRRRPLRPPRNVHRGRVMALCRYGPLVNVVSGSIGSVTFKSGASSGVLTRRRVKQPLNSTSQQHQHAVIATHAARWTSTGSAFAKTWATLGRTFQAANRVGVRKSLTARATFMSYLGQVDPDGQHPELADYPPNSSVSVAPRLDWTDFDIGNVAWITVWNLPLTGCTERLWIRRWLNFGPRNSGGRRIYCGALERTLPFLNWNDNLVAAGIDRQLGEQLGLEITWTTPDANWPSIASTTISTVWY